MRVDSASSNVRFISVRANEPLNQSKKTDNNFANNLNSAGNSPEAMRTPERKGLMFYITKFINFFKPNTQQVICDMETSNKIRSQVDDIKNYDMKILKHGDIHDVADRRVVQEFLSPTTPTSVANKLLILAQQAKDNNDEKSLNQCMTLFDTARAYGKNQEFHNRDAGMNQKLWSRPERVTTTQTDARNALAPKA